MDPVALTRFLHRYPWSDQAFLARVFSGTLPDHLSGRDLPTHPDVQSVAVPGVGRCLAIQDEPLESLACIWRWRLARSFALETMGRTVVLAGISPGFAADGEFWWQDRWWRVWADLGSCAPEALPLSRRTPKQFGPGVRDVVVTTHPERLGILVAQVEQHFFGPARVTVWLYGSERYRVARPNRSVPVQNMADPAWIGDGPAAMKTYLKKRMRKTRADAERGQIAAALSPAAWDLLIYVGNNPLLTVGELAYLLASDVADFDRVQKRISHLMQLRLLTAKPMDGQERLVLSRTALQLLALYWGAAQHDLLRFLPWPQRRDDHGRIAYALTRLTAIDAHTRLVRQFALALVDSSRRVTNAAGGLDVTLITMVGSRVLYQESGSDAFSWVVPDAALQVSFWETVRTEDDRERRVALNTSTVFLEVDRATNAIGRLEGRLDHYARVWASLEQEQQAQLVWLMDGTPWREYQILEAMRARKIRGWTVTLDRLLLQSVDEWWQAHPAGGLSLEHTAFGGMAPLRSIWQCTQAAEAQPFLGTQPWRKGRLAHPRERGKESKKQ